MAVSKKQQKCVNKYIDKHYDRINLTMPKGKKERLQAVAREKGKSVNTFINDLIDGELKQYAGSFGNSPADTDNN